MPTKSDKQRRFMAAVANNPEFARSAGVSQSVGEEVMKADKKKYKSGGKVKGCGKAKKGVRKARMY